jgi:hypothetical protein
MPDIEFLPESVDEPDAGEELSGGSRRTLVRLVSAFAVGSVVLAALLLATTRKDSTSLPTPTPTAPVVPPLPRVINPVNGVGLKHVPVGPTAGEPVLDIAVLGDSTWVLQADALHVVRPGRMVRIMLPAALQDAQLITDVPSRLVWLVAKGVVGAYDARTGRIEFGARVPTFTAAAAMQRHLFLAVGLDLIEIGPGMSPRNILTTRAPITLLVADPTRARLIASYQSGPSQLQSIVPRANGPARAGRSATIRSVEATIVDVAGAIWLAGFTTGDGVLMRLDPRTLRPALHPSSDGLFDSGAQLVGAGASSIWVRSSDTGNQLFCLDATTGRLMQSWLLGGSVASTDHHAVLGSTFGPLVLDLGRCHG